VTNPGNTNRQDGTVAGPAGQGSFQLTSEFASVQVSLDRNANGPRLLVRDLESGDQIYLDPLELASFCHATEDDRASWLRVGPYRNNLP
jgi:hypothetical protein